MSDSVVLSVGDKHHIRRGKDHIVYAGMLSEKVYSMAQIKQDGYRGYAWNLFFPIGQSDIKIDEVNFSVENVSPKEIRLRLKE